MFEVDVFSVIPSQDFFFLPYVLGVKSAWYEQKAKAERKMMDFQI